MSSCLSQSSYSTRQAIFLASYYPVSELPHDSAIPLLGIYIKEIKSLSGRDICSIINNSQDTKTMVDRQTGAEQGQYARYRRSQGQETPVSSNAKGDLSSPSLSLITHFRAPDLSYYRSCGWDSPLACQAIDSLGGGTKGQRVASSNSHAGRCVTTPLGINP